MVQKQTENCEEDRVLRWMSPLYAIELLIHDHQKWAVEQALLLQNKRISFYMKKILFTVNFFKLRAGFLIPPFYNYKPMKIISPPTVASY